MSLLNDRCVCVCGGGGGGGSDRPAVLLSLALSHKQGQPSAKLTEVNNQTLPCGTQGEPCVCVCVCVQAGCCYWILWPCRLYFHKGRAIFNLVILLPSILIDLSTLCYYWPTSVTSRAQQNRCYTACKLMKKQKHINLRCFMMMLIKIIYKSCWPSTQISTSKAFCVRVYY